ncbi:hypothetical protein BJ170DRAFT_621238 [Xylariales sp. AK1849]|nr:hypothetical protein BJ170DRAFT_621238 [Xylariales sp. AK1849]
MDSLELTGHDAHQPIKSGQPPQPKRLQLSRRALFTSLFILAPVLAVVSAIEIGLAAEGAKRGPPADPSEWIRASFFTEPKNYTQTLSDYPTDVFSSQDTLRLASASLSLICAVVLGGVAWYASVNGPARTLYWLRHALLAILGVNAVLSLATFLYAFIAHGLSAHFDISYAMELTNMSFGGVYDRGTFDLETWACETKDLPHYDSFPEGRVHTLCTVETGARWMTLFVFLLATSLFVVMCLDRCGEKRLVATWKNRRASWHDDYY